MRTPPRRVAKPGLEPHGPVPTAVPRTAPRSQAPTSKESELAPASRRWSSPANATPRGNGSRDLVARQQRRAVRIAYHYLRDAHDADEAVQDAFLKVFTHITTYREELPFEVWFTRILVNGCLDLRKARARRLRWALPMSVSAELAHAAGTGRAAAERRRSPDVERTRATDHAAVEQLPDRQRRCSRSATSPSRPPARSARRSGSARPRCACICSAPSASCGSCSSGPARNPASSSRRSIGKGRRDEPRSPHRRSTDRDLPGGSAVAPARRATSAMRASRCESRRVALASTLADVTARVIAEADELFPAGTPRAAACPHPAAGRHLGRPAASSPSRPHRAREPVRPRCVAVAAGWPPRAALPRSSSGSSPSI